MRAILFSYLAKLCNRPYDATRLRSDINVRLLDVRAKTASGQDLIPPDVTSLNLGQIDDLISVCWLMTAREHVDMATLLQLDALGASLGLVGCEVRLRLQVIDVLQEGRPNSETEAFTYN